jgi:nitrite reductase/ring-hydroxylating ferredoxin subunit
MPDHETYPPFPSSRLPHVGTYRRVLPVSLVRMYENALDWEHLPFVHSSSFRSIECLDSGPWGWRARTVSSTGDENVIELRLDRACRRWITRTLEGRNQGAEIWTHAFPIEPVRVDIVVDFFVPGVAPELREKVGGAYAALYTRLYDEDVAMMVERQHQLDRRMGRTGSGEVLDLGPREGLSLPLTVELDGRAVVVNESDGELVAYPALCPHQLGPLNEGALENGAVTCPWHGYAFDVRTGDCRTGQTCRLTDLPQISEADGRVSLMARRP